MTRTVTSTFCLTAILWLSWLSLAGAQVTSNATSQQAREIIAKLHPGIEPMDESVERDRQELVTQGARILDGVRAILQTNDDPMVVGTLAGVVTRMKDERAALLPTVRGMAKRDQPWAREICAAVLGEIGQAEDRDLLIQLIADRNERVRLASVKSIAKIGCKDDIERLAAIVDARSKNLTAEEKTRDPLLQELAGA